MSISEHITYMHIHATCIRSSSSLKISSRPSRSNLNFDLRETIWSLSLYTFHSLRMLRPCHHLIEPHNKWVRKIFLSACVYTWFGDSLRSRDLYILHLIRPIWTLVLLVTQKTGRNFLSGCHRHMMWRAHLKYYKYVRKEDVSFLHPVHLCTCPTKQSGQVGKPWNGRSPNASTASSVRMCDTGYDRSTKTIPFLKCVKESTLLYYSSPSSKRFPCIVRRRSLEETAFFALNWKTTFA